MKMSKVDKWFALLRIPAANGAGSYDQIEQAL
jgi:hypothetical protein